MVTNFFFFSLDVNPTQWRWESTLTNPLRREPLTLWVSCLCSQESALLTFPEHVIVDQIADLEKARKGKHAMPFKLEVRFFISRDHTLM